jgi:peroxiredoxin
MRTFFVGGLIVGVALLAAPHIQGDDDEKPTPAKQYQAIVSAYKEGVIAYSNAYHAAKTDEDRQSVSKALGAKSSANYYAPKMLDVIRNNPKDDVAFDAIDWLHVHVPAADEFGEAVDLVLRNLIQDERLAKVCQNLGRYNSCSAGDKLLQAAIDVSPHRKVQGFARFALAVSYKRTADARLGDTPKGPHPLEQKADALLQEVIDKYADLEFESTTLGKEAEAAQFELRHLGIGKTAPEIEGEDIAGKRMKLSDFRGKVTLVVFWTTSCGACMVDVPKHQTLLKRLEGKPFAIVGIDSNEEDREAVKKVCTEKGITWRSFWDADLIKGRVPMGRIASRWNLDAWPTLYLLDSEGVIRGKGQMLRAIGGRMNKDGKFEEIHFLDDAVDALLKEMTPKKP